MQMSQQSDTHIRGLDTCNCITLLHYPGHPTLCRYLKPITARMQIVLELYYQGLTKYQVASKLSLSVAGVESIVSRVNKKLNTHSVWDSVLKAKEHGLIL